MSADSLGSIGAVTVQTEVASLLRRIEAALAARRSDVTFAFSTIDLVPGRRGDVILFSLSSLPASILAHRLSMTRAAAPTNVAISRRRALCLVVGGKEFAARAASVLCLLSAEAGGRSLMSPRDQFDSDGSVGGCMPRYGAAGPGASRKYPVRSRTSTLRLRSIG